MKFCEHCGHGLSDDAAFCSGCGKPCVPEEAPPAPVFCEQCGAQLAPDQAFCEGCGCPTVPAQPVPNPVYVPQPQTPTAAGASRKKLPKWLLITLISVAGVALAIGIFALCGGFIHRAEMPASINKTTVSVFLKEAYENSSKDYRIDDISSYSTYDYARVVAEISDLKTGSEYEVTFRREDNNTAVFVSLDGAVYGNSDYTQYELYQLGENYEFAKDFIITLEKTLSGTSKADEYLDDYEKMHAKAQRARMTSDDYYNIPLAQYSLGSGIIVEIVYSNVYSDEWTIGYRLYVY